MEISVATAVFKGVIKGTALEVGWSFHPRESYLVIRPFLRLVITPFITCYHSYRAHKVICSKSFNNEVLVGLEWHEQSQNGHNLHWCFSQPGLTPCYKKAPCSTGFWPLLTYGYGPWNSTYPILYSKPRALKPEIPRSQGTHKCSGFSLSQWPTWINFWGWRKFSRKNQPSKY